METQEAQVRVCARAGLAPKGSWVPSAMGCPQKGGGWREDDWHPLSVSAAHVTKWDRILAWDVSVVWLWGWNSKSENGRTCVTHYQFHVSPCAPNLSNAHSGIWRTGSSTVRPGCVGADGTEVLGCRDPPGPTWVSVVGNSAPEGGKCYRDPAFPDDFIITYPKSSFYLKSTFMWSSG